MWSEYVSSGRTIFVFCHVTMLRSCYYTHNPLKESLVLSVLRSTWQNAKIVYGLSVHTLTTYWAPLLWALIWLAGATTPSNGLRPAPRYFPIQRIDVELNTTRGCRPAAAVVMHRRRSDNSRHISRRCSRILVPHDCISSRPWAVG